MDEEERRLWERYAETRAVVDRNVLIVRFRELAKGAAVKAYSQMSNHVRGQLTIDDLESAASMGLLQAVERFDLSRGWKFTTFSPQRIKGAILDYLRDSDFLSRSHRAAITRGEVPAVHKRSIDEASYESDNGRAATLQDLDNALAVEPESDAQFWFWDQENVRELLRPLHGREKEVVTLYYSSTLNMKQIGEKFGFSESRISQIITRAIDRLRIYHGVELPAPESKPEVIKIEEERPDLMQEFFQQFKELKLPEVEQRIQDLEGELRAMKVLRDAVSARDQKEEVSAEEEGRRQLELDDDPSTAPAAPLPSSRRITSITDGVVATLYDHGPCKPVMIRNVLGISTEKAMSISSALQNLQKVGRVENTDEGWALSGQEKAVETRRRAAADAES